EGETLALGDAQQTGSQRFGVDRLENVVSSALPPSRHDTVQVGIACYNDHGGVRRQLPQSRQQLLPCTVRQPSIPKNCPLTSSIRFDSSRPAFLPLFRLRVRPARECHADSLWCRHRPPPRVCEGNCDLASGNSAPRQAVTLAPLWNGDAHDAVTACRRDSLW